MKFWPRPRVSSSGIAPRARVEIRRYHPLRRLLARFAILAAALLLLAVSHISGRLATAPRVADEAMGVAELEAQVRAARDELRVARQQLATAQAAVAVERAAASEVRSDLSRAQATADRLARESELYRSLMDSSVRTRGLTLHKLEVRPSGAERTFEYRITLLQRAQRHAELQGTLSLSLKGRQDGKAAVLSGSRLGPGAVERTPLRLLYFQVLEGELRLPEGFEPEQLRIVLDIVKGRPQKLDYLRDWNPREG